LSLEEKAFNGRGSRLRGGLGDIVLPNSGVDDDGLGDPLGLDVLSTLLEGSGCGERGEEGGGEDSGSLHDERVVLFLFVDVYRSVGCCDSKRVVRIRNEWGIRLGVMWRE